MGFMTSDPRTPIDPAAVNQALAGSWRVEAVSVTESTNADLLAAAAGGAPAGLVRVAEFQSIGRGRLDRSWTSPPGAGLTFSMLLRPSVPLSTWGWLPLLAGVALVDAVRTLGLTAALKWPNDLLVGAGQVKAAGILSQVADGAAVIGVGLNVSTTLEELPVPTATSLLLQAPQAQLDRGALLVDFLTLFAAGYHDWQSPGGDLAERYRQRCVTIGQRVTVQLADRMLTGTAVGVDDEGRLLVAAEPAAEPGAAPEAVAAGDVTHVRPGAANL
jgi:BirA family biotin operon repressor/biotin-[acetyl-CoA-carboxylase] ligase